MSVTAIPFRRAAKAFIGSSMEALSNILGINQTNTLTHNPKSNVKMERVWEFVVLTLKTITVEKYVQFHLHFPVSLKDPEDDQDTGHPMDMRIIARHI